MSYYPKKMVNAGLYTQGNEYVDALNGKPYSGYYHQLYNGQVYSGKDPRDPNRKPLTEAQNSKKQTTQVLPIQNNLVYSQLKPLNQELYEYGRDPEHYVAQPTGDDYKRGKITRYFAKRKNQTPIQIREISEQAFNDITNRGGIYNYALWDVISMFWKITGPLYDSKDKYGILKAGIVNTNERLRDSANTQFRGIKQYLSNLIQYSARPDITLVTNQYTAGNEFTVKQDNSDYTGYYHIMADGTIMDGADMSQTTNKTLLAGNVLVQNRINTLVKEELGKLGAA
jgi:hypothetical protein